MTAYDEETRKEPELLAWSAPELQCSYQEFEADKQKGCGVVSLLELVSARVSLRAVPVSCSGGLFVLWDGV